MKTPSVIVIGAGIGGIAAAAHLARRGVHVTVLEKNSRPGGRCDRFSRDGHYFDTGPTLLVMPRLYEAEFAALGTSLREMLNLQRVDPTYHLVFDDGSRLALTSDPKAMREQLESIEPGSYHGFVRYVEEGRRHYELAMDRLVNRDFRTASEFFTLSNLPLLFRLKPLVQHLWIAYLHTRTMPPRCVDSIGWPLASGVEHLPFCPPLKAKLPVAGRHRS